jgi:TM2 domain-containing membrane protein YozV
MSDKQVQFLITFILWLFLWPLGVHRFFNGKILIGILQLLTIGGFGVWALIDLILLVCCKMKDSDDEYITWRKDV